MTRATIELDQVSHRSPILRAQERRVLGEEGWIVRVGAVHGGRREHHELPDLMVRHMLEQLLKRHEVPLMALALRHPGVVHHAEVHDGAHALLAEDVARLLSAEVDRVHRDIRRSAVEGPPIDADDARPSMEHARDQSTEPSADARDEHRAARIVGRRRDGLRPRRRGHAPTWRGHTRLRQVGHRRRP